MNDDGLPDDLEVLDVVQLLASGDSKDRLAAFFTLLHLDIESEPFAHEQVWTDMETTVRERAS
jgi:hypothetical protein